MFLRASRSLSQSTRTLGRRFASTITKVKGRSVIDSRGNPTVEVDLWIDNGSKMTRASVPSGASTGAYEALELRDGGDAFMGKGVMRAVENINSVIGPAIQGMDPTDQKSIDDKMVRELDGSKNEWGWSKSNLGANAILGVSIAVCRAGAVATGEPLYRHIANLAGNRELTLPVPSFNIINGGSHAGNALAMQEFMVLPTGAGSFSEALQIGCEVYQTLSKVIRKRYGQDAVNVGDEGGFAPNISSNEEGLALVREAIEAAGYWGRVDLGMDVAASEFLTGSGNYDLNFKNQPNDGSQVVSGDELLDIYSNFCENYPMVSIEDPFDQDDWKNWSKMTAKHGDKVQIVGDDLLVTNPSRIQQAIDTQACNALLLKVNQIGSISESIEAVSMAKRAGWAVMTSHRSGETEDNFIADLAVGLSTGQIKTGAPCRSERLAKYNQLLRIEEEIEEAGGNVKYAGKAFRFPSQSF